MPADFSNLVGRTFVSQYDGEDVVVHAAFIYHGEVRLIVSKEGGTLHETSIDGIKPKYEK